MDEDQDKVPVFQLKDTTLSASGELRTVAPVGEDQDKVTAFQLKDTTLSALGESRTVAPVGEDQDKVMAFQLKDTTLCNPSIARILPIQLLYSEKA